MPLAVATSCGEEARAVEVDEGAQVVVEVGVDLGQECVGDVEVAEPPADDGGVPALDEGVVVGVPRP